MKHEHPCIKHNYSYVCLNFGQVFLCRFTIHILIILHYVHNEIINKTVKMTTLDQAFPLGVSKQAL